MNNKLEKIVNSLKLLGYSELQLASNINISLSDFQYAMRGKNADSIVDKLSKFFDLNLENTFISESEGFLRIDEKERHHKDVSSVLRYLMKDVGGISEGELSRRTCIPQPTIHRILSGMTPNPRVQSIQPLADFFNVTTDQLLGRISLPDDRIPGTFDAAVKTRLSIPIITLEDAIRWPLFKKKIEKIKTVNKNKREKAENIIQIVNTNNHSALLKL